jgi:C1A family cysteine protease
MQNKSRVNKKYGWRPDTPDARDIKFKAPRRVSGPLPPKVDLRSKCPAVLNQGELGSCTANAIGNAHFFAQKKAGSKKQFLPSRLFIYYNERALEGTIAVDAGAEIRNGFKTLSKQGGCPEVLWPYTVSKFRTKPPKPCYTEALKSQAIVYSRLSQNASQLKGCLANGYPFVFGFAVYESFESDQVARDGIGSMPTDNDDMLGGHAVLAVGYDDSLQRFIMMNSWGTGWGNKGYFTLPYEYVLDTNLADDFWTVHTVEHGV